MSAALSIATTIPPFALESWIAVLFGGLIPIIGALAVLYIIVRAVRDSDEEDEVDEE